LNIRNRSLLLWPPLLFFCSLMCVFLSLSSCDRHHATPQDDETGESLMQRPDDTSAALVSRLEEYHGKTTPVFDHYSSVVSWVESGGLSWVELGGWDGWAKRWVSRWVSGWVGMG
jgi:hypothetical protein